MHGNVPTFSEITNGLYHDVIVYEMIETQSGAIDMCYVDDEGLFKIHLRDVFFVARAKSHMAWQRLCNRFYEKNTWPML